MDEPGVDLLSELLLQTEESSADRASLKTTLEEIKALLQGLGAGANNSEITGLLDELRAIRAALSIKAGRKGKISFTVTGRDGQERISQAEIEIK